MKGNPALWYTIAFVLVAAIAAYAVISVRKTRREHLRRSQERASAMLLALHQAAAASKAASNNAASPAAPATGAAAPAAPAAAPVVPPDPPPAQAQTPARAAAAASPAALVRRPRALTAAQRLVFLVLRSALPDHVVMPNLRIGDLLEPPAALPDARFAELARARVDFVVCNNALEPIAAVVIHDGGDSAAASDQLRIEALREIGVRYLRFRTDNLPKPAEARAFVLG